MIKKNKQGKVVEFEDEVAVASMNKSYKPKSAKGVVEPAGESLMNDKQALAEYEAALKAIEIAAEATLKDFMLKLGGEVAQLDNQCRSEKTAAKAQLEGALAEAIVAYQQTVERIEKAHRPKLDAIRSVYRTTMATINAKAEAGKIEVQAAKKQDIDAALTVYEARLAAISEAEMSAAKLEAVSAESLPTVCR